LVDKIESEDKAISSSDLIILAIPVSALSQLIPSILDSVKKNAVVIDTGSTKSLHLSCAVPHHTQRAQFVAAHQIAGTENSGPEAAFSGLFRDKTNIICEKEKSSDHALAIAEKVFAMPWV
jgi:prephenate dehydrogenase